MKHNYLLILAIFAIKLATAQIVNIPDANFKNALLNTSCASINDYTINSDVDTNDDGEIQVSEAETVILLDVSNQNITSLEGIEAFINLRGLMVGNNQLSSLDISALVNMYDLILDNNLFTALNDIVFPTNDQPFYFSINNNLLTSINSSDLPTKTDTFLCENNQITSIDLSAISFMYELNCSGNPLTSLILPQFSNTLYGLICNDTALTELNLTGFNNYSSSISCSNNSNLLSVNLHNANAVSFYCENNPQLETISLKNGYRFNTYSGSGYSYHICNNPNLKFICADENEIENQDYTVNEGGTIFTKTNYGIKQLLENCGYTDVVVSSYCSFTPGGEYYTIQGTNTFDENNDGCDAGDSTFPNLKYNIANAFGTNQGSFFSDDNGNYTFYIGDTYEHIITPQLEHPEYYTVSPENYSVNFQTDTSPFTQDFCIVPNGSFNDLEITIVPIELARPGFDANYKLVLKNKGTTTLSGTVDFAFDDNLMDFSTANPAANSQSTNLLSWNYSNLEPFASLEILITLTLNTPMDTPALNGDDILNFTATANPVSGDETPIDNTFILNQTVVNSYDPNDKTCLEGDTITPDLIGEFVHYLVRFENTGSAEAINVVVKDFIDLEKFDISTLFLTDSSHDVETRISNNNLVEFIFEGINLPFDDANNDGYVAFKIKTLPTLVEGDTFENDAEIYFDYNFPIITNVASTSIQSTLSVTSNEFSSSFNLYPNPIKNRLFIEGSNNIKHVNFYDISGRMINQISYLGNYKIIDVSTENLSPGTYFIKVFTSDGDYTKRVVKE